MIKTEAIMCGRKYDSEVAEMERAVQSMNWDGPNRTTRMIFDFGKPDYDIRPTNQHVVALDVEDEVGFESMKWGFQPAWAKRVLINSRDDSLEKKTWKKPFATQRCAIPVGGFYEWTGPKNNRQPHAFSQSDGEVMWLAGLWVESEGEHCYTVLTADASRWMAQYHNREPVIIEPIDLEEYLFSDSPPFHLVAAKDDGFLSEFPCDRPNKSAAPQLGNRSQ